jgi:hypothetical protein
MLSGLKDAGNGAHGALHLGRYRTQGLPGIVQCVNLPVTVPGVGPSAGPHLAVAAGDHAVSTGSFASWGALIKTVIRLIVARAIARNAQRGSLLFSFMRFTYSTVPGC